MGIQKESTLHLVLRLRGGVIMLETLQDFDEQIKKEKLTIVDFTAAWCGPCQGIAPKFEEFSKEFTEIDFVKVDVDENGDAADKAAISNLPTFQFYKGGNMVFEVKGASEEKLKEAILEYKDK